MKPNIRNKNKNKNAQQIPTTIRWNVYPPIYKMVNINTFCECP